MVELTEQQQQAVHTDPQTPFIDPQTQKAYVLVDVDVFARLKALILASDEQGFVDDAYGQVMEVFGRAGWNDPAMDVYDALDPRRKIDTCLKAALEIA